MKQICRLLIVVSFLFNIVFVVLAQQVSISPASVESPAVGGQFTVSLEIQGGQNVAGYQVTVAFDTSALRYVSSANSDYLPAGAFFVPANCIRESSHPRRSQHCRGKAAAMGHLRRSRLRLSLSKRPR